MKPEPNSKNDEARPEVGVPFLTEEVDSIQVFEDHDTRGDPRYPPAKQPRNIPRSTRPDSPRSE